MIPPRISVSVRDSSYQRGGPVVPYRLSSTDIVGPISAACVARYPHVLLLVHGYNNTQQDAAAAYDAIAANLDSAGLFAAGDAPKAILGFHWPGNVAVVQSVDFLDVLGYPQDIAQALAAAVELEKFLSDVLSWGGQLQQISVICHSLGSRLLLEALARLGPSRFTQLIALLAAALPVDLVDASRGTAATLAATGDPPREIRKYHSWIDWVLTLGFPAGQSLAFIDGIEKAEYVEAVGAFGDPASFGVEPPYTGLHFHSDYWGNGDIAADIAGSIAPTCRVTLPPRPLPSPYDLPGYSLPQPS
jgi:hypothetical protein